MGLGNFIKEQFLDIIEYIDQSDKILVHKYDDRERNEIKQGAKVIVREGQYAVFVKGGTIADTFGPGTYRLETGNLPILSSLMALPHLFNSPIKSDLYFISTKQSIDNKWATKNPIMLRDNDFGVLRLRAFGTFSFRITDVEQFMREVFGSQKKVLTWDIVQYISSFVCESFSDAIAELKIPALDMASNYKKIGNQAKIKANVECESLGIEILKINIENISLPESVEKLIDEQSGMGLASKDMETYAQYQSIRSMRDASQQDSGLAGIGAGIVLGNQLASNIQSVNKNKDVYEEIKKYKELFDMGAITQDEYDALKRKILKI